MRSSKNAYYMLKERDIAVDILKFFGALLITNSHFSVLYGNYSFLATGGTLGDVLFFFCSGYTLFLGRVGRFDNWYKRRINRIYPSVLAWGLIGSVVWGYEGDLSYLLLYGGGWFVQCILVYYIVFYILIRFGRRHLQSLFVVFTIISIVAFFCWPKETTYMMWGATMYKLIPFSLYMFLGALMGVVTNEGKRAFYSVSAKTHAIVTICSVLMWYGIFIMARYSETMSQFQIVSILPLMTFAYSFYNVCKSNVVQRLYRSRYLGWVMSFISGLCLEIYICQAPFVRGFLPNLFPLNILIAFCGIVTLAYCVRTFGRFIKSTFNDKPYEWKEIFKFRL